MYSPVESNAFLKSIHATFVLFAFTGRLAQVNILAYPGYTVHYVNINTADSNRDNYLAW